MFVVCTKREKESVAVDSEQEKALRSFSVGIRLAGSRSQLCSVSPPAAPVKLSLHGSLFSSPKTMAKWQHCEESAISTCYFLRIHS